MKQEKGVNNIKELTKEDIKKINDVGNVIEIYDVNFNLHFKFYYVYSGDSQEVVFLNNRFYGYFDLDEYVDKIKTREDEKKYLTKLIKEEMEVNFYSLIEELEFIDSNILKDIRGEK